MYLLETVYRANKCLYRKSYFNSSMITYTTNHTIGVVCIVCSSILDRGWSARYNSLLIGTSFLPQCDFYSREGKWPSSS